MKKSRNGPDPALFLHFEDLKRAGHHSVGLLMFSIHISSVMHMKTGILRQRALHCNTLT